MGGGAVSSGQGDSFLANCLSKPNGTAGIQYGRNGVCHQTGNRILLPALQRVELARGYWVSHNIYGHYGRGLFGPKLVSCYAEPTGSKQLVHFDDPSIQRILSEKASDMRDDHPGRASLSELMRFADGHKTVLQDVHDMCEFACKDAVTTQEQEGLAANIAHARLEQQRLVDRLGSGELTKHEYLEAMHVLSANCMALNEQILGPRRFSIIYGDAGHHLEGLIDPGLFLAAP